MDAKPHITIDNILYRVNRYIKNEDIDEEDIIEIIGEGMSLLQLRSNLQNKMKFIPIFNHQGDLPKYLRYILQVAQLNDEDYFDEFKRKRDAKNNRLDLSGSNCTYQKNTDNEFNKSEEDEDKKIICEEKIKRCKPVHKECNCIEEFEKVKKNFNNSVKMLSFDLPYYSWVKTDLYKNRFSPMKPASNTMFNAIVCKDKYFNYCKCNAQYSIVGKTDKKIRTSFKEGIVAISYLCNEVDEETGYPLIPDDEYCLSALQNYVLWQVCEMKTWEGRQGYDSKANKYYKMWTIYKDQYKAKSKLPQSLDEMYELLKQNFVMIPDLNKHNNFYENLGEGDEKYLRNGN